MHAEHMLGADDLHPHLLKRIISIFRLTPRRHAGSVHPVVVVPQP